MFVFSGTATYYLNANQLYEVYIEQANPGGPGSLILQWSVGGSPFSLVTVDNFGIEEDIGSSPYQILVLPDCPTGQQKSSSPNSVCEVTCGDSLTYGQEVCDDGNTQSEDGCSAD